MAEGELELAQHGGAARAAGRDALGLVRLGLWELLSLGEYPLLSTSLHFAAKVSKEADGASPRSGSSAAMLISGDFSATSFAAWRGGKRACQLANAGACRDFGHWQA